MKTSPIRAVLEGIALAVLGLLFAFGTAQRLRAHLLRNSHYRPEPEYWIEPTRTASPEQLKLGKHLYYQSCAHCHGEDATGDEGPDLHALQMSDRYISNVIRRGIKGEMPSFAKKHNAEQISALIAYLRTLNETSQ